MAEIIGFDPTVQKKLQVTCRRGCGAIIQYTKPEVQTRTYTCMGDPSGHEYVVCPNCGEDARIRSW